MTYQGPSTSFSSPSSDKVDGHSGTLSSPYTTGFASAASQSNRHGSLAAHYYHTRGVVAGGAGAPAMATHAPASVVDRAVQRQDIIDHVNAFLARYEIAKVVTDVQQCTSSLFVLLYQRFFDCTIQGIEQSPNTPEKKRRNVQLVLEELERQGYSVNNVEADEVVRLNEDHISRLVMVFVRIAEDMQLQEALGYMAGVPGGGLTGTAPSTHLAAPLTQSPTTGYAPYSGEAGLGYTVAEVARRPGATADDAGLAAEYGHTHQPAHITITTAGPHQDEGSAAAAPGQPHLVYDAQGIPYDVYYHEGSAAHLQGLDHHPHHPHHPHHHAAGAATGSFHEEDYGDEEEENRSGIGSYMVDTSVMPTDRLLDEWYRDLETPALGEGSLNLSYPTTERRSSRGSRHGDSAATPLRSPPTRPRPGAYAAALDTADIRQRHRLLNETLDRLEARRPETSAAAPRTGPGAASAAAKRRTATASTTSLGSYHSGIGSGAGAHAAGSRRPPRSSVPPVPLEEPPLTRAESRLLASHPYRQIDAEYRDRKIERLRAARFLANSQDLIRQRMRRQHDASMAEMRRGMKSALATSTRERYDRMQQVRDENERYRHAYETLMEAAANDVRVPRYMMSRHTAELAEYFADSLHESQRMCEYLEAERARRNRADVMRYAESVTAWQRQAYA